MDAYALVQEQITTYDVKKVWTLASILCIDFIHILLQQIL